MLEALGSLEGLTGSMAGFGTVLENLLPLIWKEKRGVFFRSEDRRLSYLEVKMIPAWGNDTESWREVCAE